MREKLVFLGSYLRHPADVSSVIPTSRWAVRRVAAKVPKGAKMVVEYGPGTGVVSREILKNLREDGELVLIEKTPALAEHLRKEFAGDDRVRVVCGSAEDVRTILASEGPAQADCVLTSIPLSVFTPELRRRILEETKAVLAPGAPLVVFLFRAVNEEYVREVFGHVTREREWRNIPPLRIFVAKAGR